MRLEAFEMWVWRRMANVKWTDKLANVEFLNLVNETDQSYYPRSGEGNRDEDGSDTF